MVTRLLWLVVLCAAASLAITGSQCAQLTGSRKFLSVDGSDDDREPPAVLWTTPGAGNTWVRQLIEYATGVHTGSMYNDESIESQMPGEKRCDRSVVVVKGHPEHRTFDMVFNASREDPCENSPYTTRSVCLKQFAKYVSSCGGRPDFFRRAVAVVRDPFKTLLAEYQRFTKQEADRLSRTQSKGSGAHTSVMRDLDPKAFSEWALPAARRMIEDWRQYARLAKLGRDRIHFVRYEDLMARNLRALADLVGFVTPTFAQPGGGKAGSRQQAGVNRQQLQCAFEQASGGAFRRSTVDKRQLENRAFLSVVGPHTNETTACALWRVFGALGSRLGYAPPGVCGTAEIEKVGGDILALADRARTAGLARPRSVAAPVDSRLFLPACGPQKVSVRVKDHGTYVAVARLSCERTLEEESVIVRSERTTTTTLVGLQVIQTKSAAPKNSAAHQQSQQQQQRRSSSSSSPQQRVYVRKRLYEKMIEVPLEQTKDWKWRGFGSLMLNPGSFDVVVEDASRHEEVCRFSHVALIGSANTSTAEVSYSLVSDTNPLVWDCGEGETSKTNKRRSIALELLRKRAIRKTIVLTACTKELAAIALNWAVHLERSSIFNYALGALDDETMTRLGSTLGGPVFRVPTRESRHAASFFDVVLGVPELSVLYVDVRAVLVSSHVQSMLQSQPHLGMRCAPVSHCSTLLWMPRADTPEKMSNRERLVEELSVLRPLPESRTSSSLAPLDKPAWPSLNAALNSIDCVTPWTHEGQDVVENFCGGQQQQLSPSSPSTSSSRDDPRRIEDVDDDDDKRGRESQLVAAYALCPRRLQILKQKAHSKRFKVFFENEYQTDLGWTLTPYARYVIDSAVKAKGNGASSDVLPRIDFFSDLLAHIESLPKSPPRNLLKFTKDYSAFTAAKVPALTVIVSAPRATSMQAQVESFGAAAVAAEATFELVFVLREKNDVLRRSFPYKPYNLWATLSVVLVRDESDYVPKSPWIARLANDALVSTNFGYWFARFRLSVDASENVRVVAPCVATVANVLHGSSPTDDKDFDRLDCAESTTISGKLECHAWLADHISLVHVNGMKRKYVADSSSSSSKSGGGWTSSFEKNTTGGSLAAAGQLAVRSLYAKIGAIASLASWKPPSLSKVTTTRSLESCGAMMGRESDSPIGDDAGAVFEMRSSSTTTTTKGARVEILPSALMVMRHEETRPAAMPTSSSSSHSSKAKKFERLTPQKAIADLDLFGSPDKALETLAAMNVFVFAVETLGGLANRLRAVSTNWALSAKLGRPMIVSWPIDPECEAQPGSLFDLERSVKLPFVNRSWPNPRSPGVSSSKLNKIVKNIETHVRDVASKKAMMPPRAKPERGVIILTNTVLGGATVSPSTEEATDAQKQKQGAPSPAPSPPPPPLERPVHLYARTQRHAVYSRYWSFFLGYTTLDVRAALIGLRPSDFVTSRIRTEYSKVVDAVGLHVRMQWNETESVRGLEGSRDTELRSHFHQDNKKNLEAYHERREDCHLNNFRAYLSEKFLKPASTANRVSPPQAKEDIKFFVACDVTGCLDQFDSDDRAGHVVRDLQHHRQLVESDCFRDSRSSRCQQLAFVEIHLLASCKSLLISRHSSFSDIASLLSRSFRPNDDMVYGGSPRDMAVQSACGYLDERSRKNATLSSASSPSSSNSSAALQRKFGFPFTPSASAVVQEGSRHGRPTRAEIYRKQLFMIQAQRRKQQQQQQQHAATYSILKSTPFGATINNPNDPLVN